MSQAQEARRGDSEVVRASEHLRRLRDPARLKALADTGLMDSEPEISFDRFTRLVARWLKTEVAVVSLVDDERQFFKSALGLSEPIAAARGTPLSHSFCQYAVTSAQPLVVVDAREHPLLHSNLAVSELAVVAYAGVPLKTSDDQVLGALCAIDSAPRDWSAQDIELLQELAALTMAEIELRLKVKRLRELEAERASDQRLMRSILDCMTDPVLVHDTSGNIVLANAAADRDRPKTVTSASSFAELGAFEGDGVTPLPVERTPAMRALRGEQVHDQAIATQFPGRPMTFYSVNAAPLRSESGDVYATVTVARDMTVARANERALARSEGILRSVVRHLPNCAVLLFDKDLRYQAAEGEDLLSSVGFTREKLIGRTLREIASPERLERVQQQYLAALRGETVRFDVARNDRFYAVTATPVREGDGTVSGGLVMVYDITSHKQQELAARDEAEQSRAVSMKDELTQLCNRRGFLDLARKQLAVAQGLQRSALLFFVDLNGMKQINDQLGHEAGDAALVEMAGVLRTTFRGSDVLARLGGDEFVALLLDAGSSQIEHFSKRIQSEIEQRNQNAQRKYTLSASVGAAAYDPGAPESIDALLARADALMYEQKKQRKSQRV